MKLGVLDYLRKIRADVRERPSKAPVAAAKKSVPPEDDVRAKLKALNAQLDQGGQPCFITVVAGQAACAAGHRSCGDLLSYRAQHPDRPVRKRRAPKREKTAEEPKASRSWLSRIAAPVVQLVTPEPPRPACQCVTHRDPTCYHSGLNQCGPACTPPGYRCLDGVLVELEAVDETERRRASDRVKALLCGGSLYRHFEHARQLQEAEENGGW